VSNEQYSFERYLNVRMAYGPSFSPDGQTISFLSDITGVAEVWSIPVDIESPQTGWPQQLTFRGERVQSAWFSPREPALLVSGDIGGNELSQLFLLSADGSTFTPLTSKPEVMHLFADWSPDGKRILYSSNERDPRYYDIYERDITSGEVSVLFQSDHSNYAYRYSPDGRQALIVRKESFLRNQLFLIDITAGSVRALTPPVPEGDHAQYTQAAWSADGQGLYLLSDRGREFLSLAYLDLSSEELTYLNDLSWDTEHLAVTHDGTALAIVINEDGYSRLELYDVSQGWHQRRALPAPQLPEGVIPELCWSPDGSRLAITFIAPNDSADIRVWDRERTELKRITYSAQGGIPTSSFVTPSLVRYPTFDGRSIPALLYLPQGQRSDLPVVIDVHGGPEGQERPIFKPVTQYLVAQGYAVLAPNVRGSSGYG
jgi:dipeptidyl aminopeptidase/acylaminoacyl peptidase